MANHAAQTKRKRGPLRTALKVVGGLMALLLVALVGLVVFLTVLEYHPADSEEVPIEGSVSKQLATGEEFTLVSWNIGYGALGDDADFFMDGGKSVISSTSERVEQNLADIVSELNRMNPDIALLQEVDRSSWRSHSIDQVQRMADAMPGTEHCYSLNYQTPFVPIGIPPLGKVDSGVETLSSYHIDKATREAMPLAHEWPFSTVQLKRGQLVCHIPLQNSDRELVLINEHPDAYTDAESHAKQVAAIVETLKEEAAAGNYVIAGGDWNHTFSTVDNSPYPVQDESYWRADVLNAEDLGDGWQLIMDNRVPTSRLLNAPYVDENGEPCQENPQYYMIDGYIVSDNVKVLDVETVDLQFKSSDHNPVVMKVLLEKG